MAVLFTDPGGEYYFSSGILTAIWSSNTGATLINSAPAGALTTYAIQLAANGFINRTLGANYVTLIVAGRYYVPASAIVAGNYLIQVQDGTTAQADVSVDASGHLTVTRNGTVLGTSTLALSAGSGWHYIEFVITIGPASAGSPNGSAQVYVDNVQWLSLTNVNTKNTANQYANKVSFSRAANATSYWKDVVIIETTGGTITTRQGDSQVSVVYPNASGVNQQFSNTGGASQTASVQDGRSHSGTWPDGDTSYISDSVSGHISDFAHDTLSAGSILAVVHVSYARSDVGTANFEQVALSAGTQHTSASIAVGGTYNYFFDVMETDPHTSSAWTVSNFNSATFGVAIP